MNSELGSVYYDTRRQRFRVNWRRTLSIVVGELLLREILQARPFIRGRLLDVGCGKRPYAAIYEPLVEKSVGTEVVYSPHGVGMADVICLAERVPFANRSFDTILCTEVLEHTIDPFTVMREFARVLKPGGYLLLSVPFIYPIHESPYDHWRFTSYGLALLCQMAGLEVHYIHTRGGLGAMLMALWGSLSVRAVNALSQLLRQSIPLRERMIVRWCLALPQWVYLGLRERCFAKVGSLRSKIAGLITLGYFVVARRGESHENTRV